MLEYPIKIGRRIKMLDWIGWTCLVISIPTLLFLAALFLFGTRIPLEISFAYYFEVLTTNYLIFLLSSGGLLIVGYKLTTFRYYSTAEIILNEGQVELVGKNISTRLNVDLIQQIEVKPLDDKQNHFTIITNNFVRRFPIKGNRELERILRQKYPEKIKNVLQQQINASRL